MTPNIDRVLRGGRQQRHTDGGERRERGGGASSSTTANGEEGDYEQRLMQLERQLSELLQKSKVVPVMLCLGGANKFLLFSQTAQRKIPGSSKPHPPGKYCHVTHHVILPSLMQKCQIHPVLSHVMKILQLSSPVNLSRQPPPLLPSHS